MFALIRTILYAVFLLWALLTFVLAAALIGKTEKAVVAPLHFLFHRRATASILAVFWVELAVVGVLWMLYLGGSSFLRLARCAT
ncbi:hypothetical protein MNV49_007212 [Pseudohyphozyma bogoriensis]|nr:hypothetical protein MNV49_007212 [Pseudohyphozyma bogoriensis]